MSAGSKWYAGIVVVFLVVSGAIALVAFSEPRAESDCKKMIERELKSPATAEWSDVESSGPEGEETVSGSVDSENEFGALVRSSFRCDFEGGIITETSVY